MEPVGGPPDRPACRGGRVPIDEFFKVPWDREIISIGSGFVVHPSGYIIVNAHGTERVTTERRHARRRPDLHGRGGRDRPRERPGLPKIDPGSPLKAVQMAKGGDFLIGEPVIVIGNPVGLRHTCTQGIISAAHRSTQLAGLPGVTLHDLIQSDAGINPGSSGGPWFNVLGR